MDDIIITRYSPSKIQKFINMHNVVFSLKYMGALHFFIGIEVKNLTNGSILLKQSKYIKNILAKSHLNEAKLENSPMMPSL